MTTPQSAASSSQCRRSSGRPNPQQAPREPWKRQRPRRPRTREHVVTVDWTKNTVRELRNRYALDRYALDRLVDAFDLDD